MAKIIFKQGKSADLANQALKDGTLSFTVDEGRIYLDYTDEGVLKRRAFYSGKLTIGDQIYDGTNDVNVDSYVGEYE